MWTAPDIPKAPQLVLGKYRLLVKLGQGGMGDVYLAGSDGLGGVGKLVVIKRLRNMEDPQHVAMFVNEARIAKQLSHPNIVQTFEIGHEADSHVLIMEYLEGPTLWRLRRLAADKGGVPWPIEIEILRSVLDGLHYAHEFRAPDGKLLRIVHRDLSSENAIITVEGDCKILDFGIAKAADSVVQTQAGFVKGKLHTMPPEQLRGLPVDRRVDVFAAGVMLWEGLSGQSLWGNLGNIAISTRLVQGDIPALRGLAPQVPDELRQICETALCPQPEGRFESALAMKAALMEYAGRNDLVVTRAQVAEFVAPLFREERERIDKIIRGQLDQQAAVRFSAMNRIPGMEGEPASTIPGAPMGITPVSATPSRLSSPAAPPPRAMRRAAVVVGTALAVVVGVWAWHSRTIATEPLPAPVRTSNDDAVSKYLSAAEQSIASKTFESARRLLAQARALPVTDPEVNIRLVRVGDALETAALLKDAQDHLDAQRWRAALESARKAHDRQPDSSEALAIMTRARAAQQLADGSARTKPRGRELPARSKKAGVHLASREPAGDAPPPVNSTREAPPAAELARPARVLPDASPPPAKPSAVAHAVTAAANPRSGPVYSAAAPKVPPPALPHTYVPDSPEQLRRMCARVESAVVSLAGVSPEYARGITGRLQALVEPSAEIYPVAMYYFIVREAGLKHDNGTAAAALAAVQRDRAILRLKDLPAVDR
jgi:serine/threonine protein kinase